MPRRTPESCSARILFAIWIMSDEAFWNEFASVFDEIEPDLLDTITVDDEPTFSEKSTDQQLSRPVSSTDSADVHVSMSPAPTPAPSTKHRATRREEIIYLLAEAQELETKLVRIRDPVWIYHDGINGQDKVWARIAARQVLALDHSTQENERLRAMVESQLRIIQSMIVFITKGEVNEIPTCSAVHYQQLCLNANALDDHVFAVKNDFVPVICDPRFLVHTRSESLSE